MSHKRFPHALISVGAVAFLLLASGSLACKKAETPAAGENLVQAADGSNLVEGLNEISGTVKSALGKYFYVSELPGYDIVAAGPIEGGDASTLLGKEIKASVIFNRQFPSFLIAQSIGIKEGENQYKPVFAGTDIALPADAFAQKSRPDYPALVLAGINRPADWEGKGKGKVRGKLIAGAGEQGQDISVIDSMTEYANYYVKKLRLFDSYWFYLDIKDSVAANLRAKNREMFHADIVFVGLY
jgi:hypothetical protein